MYRDISRIVEVERMKVAVYCRVSSEEQKQKQTINTQIDFATRYAQLHELQIVEWYKDEGVSGEKAFGNRPEGARLFADVKARRFDLLLVYKVDRLSRRLLDMMRTVEVLKEWDVTLRSMTEPFDTSTPLGNATLQLLGVFAELDRANILEKTDDGARRCARESRWLGGLAPLGYTVKYEWKTGRPTDPRLAVEPVEAALVHRIFTMCGEERMSLRNIADLLNAEGVPSRNEAREKGRVGKSGRGWQIGTLSVILHNKTYFGQNSYGKRRNVRKDGELVARKWTDPAERIIREAPPIIEPELFAKAAAALKASANPPANANRHYLLRGLITCAVCGSRYVGCGRADSSTYYYRCNSYMTGKKESRCQSATIRGDQLEAEIWADIQDFARNPGKVMQKLRAQVQAQKNALAPLEVEQEVIAGKIRGKQEERQRIIGLVRRAVISDAEADRELADLQRDIDAFEKQAAALTKRVDRSQELQAKLADADNVLHKLAQAVEGAADQKKRELIEMLVLGINCSTIVEGTKRVPHIDITYAFESVPQRLEHVRAVVSGFDGVT
jgi:site-specific DNA recombinase